MKFTFNILLILFGFTFFSAQQTFKIQGKIIDFHDKVPLKNAVIKIGDYTENSDTNGNFSFSSIKKGNYIITATHPDCEPLTEKITVIKDLEITLNLEHHISEIETVKIHAIHKKEGSGLIKTLNKEEIDRNSTENLGNLLAGISGVTALKTGNNISKPVIHGLYGTRVSIMNNGVKMAEQEWGVEHAPNVDVKMFEHIDVVKGASALKYGNESVGGVVILEPAITPKKDTILGRLKFSGISNGKGGEVALDVAKTWENQWFVKSGGSYKKLGDQYIPHHTLQNTGAEVSSFDFSFGNHSFKQGFDVLYNGIQQEFGIFKGAHLGGPEDFYKAINLGQPYFLDEFSYNIENPKQEVSHHLAKISAYKRFYNIGKISLQYSFQLNNRKEYDIRKGDLSETPSMDLRLTTHNASLTHLLERGKWKFESGIFFGLQDNFPNPATKARRLIPDYFRYDAGIFSVFKFQINDQLNAEAGARYDFNRYDAYKYYDASVWEKYANLFPEFFVKESDSRVLTHPVLDYHNFSGNVGFNYLLNKNWNFKLNFSRAERAPNAAELFADGLHHSAAIMEEGALNMKKESIYHLNFSTIAKVDFLKGLSFEINPYLMFSDSFINQIPTGVKSTNRGVFVVWSYQQIRARIFGVDADAELKFTDQLKLNASFSTLRGDDLGNQEPLILMMPTNWRNSLEWKSEKAGNLFVKLENETVFQQKRYPIRNQNVDFIENGTLVTREIDYSSTPASYSIFNAAFGFDVLRNINFNLRVNNIFNTNYKEYLNRLRYFMPEPGRNFVATVQFKF